MNKKPVWVLVLAAAICALCAHASGEEYSGLPIQPEALSFCGIRSLQEAEPNLRGQDVYIAAVCRSMTYLNGLPQDDYRFNMSHQCLKGSPVIFPDGSLGYYGLSDHATAIGGILVGFDPYGTHPETGHFFYKGVCPDAAVEVYEFWRFVSLTIFGRMDFQADVVTLSLGELYEDWWTRGINRLAEQTGVLVVASAGNGQRVYDQVLFPAAGANVLAVGVLDAEQSPDGRSLLDAFSLPRKQHSSSGPTADQRCKPDLVAPGRALVPVAYDTMEYEISGDYSSLAAPMVSGTAALLVQKAYADPRIGDPLGIKGRDCALKAILMTSARKLPWWHKGQPGDEDDAQTPLDYLQGAGLLDAMAAYRLLTEGYKPRADLPGGWDNTRLTAERTAAVYPIRIREPQGQFLTATIAWNRPYEDKYPFHPITDWDGNLRLELWAIDPASSGRVLLDVSDSPNDTVEHIYVPLPAEYQDYELIAAYSDPKAVGQTQHTQVGLAWTAGPDASADNPWWYDLNDDGIIDRMDKMLFFIYDRGRTEILEQPSIPDALSLSAERAALLAAQWNQWKPYLESWQSADEPITVPVP